MYKEEHDWVLQALMKQGMFELFSKEELEQFTHAMAKKTFQAGTKIIMEGDTSDFVYLIRKGRVSISIERKRQHIPVRTLGEGEFFGEIAVITHLTRNATVIAKTPVETYMIYRGDFRRLINQNHAIAAIFQKMINLRSRETKQFAALASIFGVAKKIFLKKFRFRIRNGTVKDLTRLVYKSSRVLIFTGRGISTESGFSSIRGTGGIWDRFLPVSFEEFCHNIEKQKEYWRRKKEFMKTMSRAKPSISHFAIMQLEKSRKLLGVVTYNTDGLHQITGIPTEKVIELKGTNREISCLHCSRVESWKSIYMQLESGVDVPKCKNCGGLLKPNTISIGQEVNQDLLFKTISWAKNCDLFIASGSSLTSEHASQIITNVKHSKTKFAIVNPSETPFDADANLLLRMQASDALPSAFTP